MQYLLEGASGNRMPITAEQAEIARQCGKFHEQGLTSHCRVFFLKNRARAPEPKPLKYGGRNNPRSPVNYRGC